MFSNTSTCRVKQRDHGCRMTLSVASTIVFAWQLLAPIAMTNSSALAGEPATSIPKVQPKVIDFTRLIRQKAEARRLLDKARQSAESGDMDGARRHAEKAAALPIDWNLTELSPDKFLEQLDSGSFDSAPAEDVASQREVIELPVKTTPSRRPRSEVIEIAPPVRERQADSKSKSEPRSLRDLGFKSSNSADDASASNDEDDSENGGRRLTPIPSLEDLAAPLTPEKNAARRTAGHAKSSLKNSTANSEPNAIVEPASSRSISTSDTESLPSLEGDDSDWQPLKKPSTKPVSQKTSEAAETVPATTVPTQVIHEIRVVERAPAAVATPAPAVNPESQFISNLNGLLLAGLFGALLVFVVIASVVTLRWFGSNPQLTFKMEMNGPLAVPMIAAPAAAPEPVAKPEPRQPEITPVYALKRQMAEELEMQQEDAMMRQVFEDNLRLREELEEVRIAA